jgi:2-C-methyl-D-erythritol 2,4-cyclodiphosphate synthase
MKIRIGQGIDFHRLETGLKLWLGGVNIPSEKGCVAHSDGDVLIHAICDALLGAAGLRDIGYYFPDSSSEFKGIDSKIILERTFGLINEKGFKIVNLDCTICLERPKIASYVPEMRKTISSLLSTEPENVSIKATTTEKLGFTGREEGIIGMAVVLLSRG